MVVAKNKEHVRLCYHQVLVFSPYLGHRYQAFLKEKGKDGNVKGDVSWQVHGTGQESSFEGL